MNLFWLVLVIICAIWALSILFPRQQVEDELSETQRQWRERHEKRIDFQEVKEQIKILEKQREMDLYIRSHRRPFRIIQWACEPLDRRLVHDYVMKLLAFSVFVVFYYPFFTTWFIALVSFLAVLTIDVYVYRKKLMLEATEWNPEFHEKFNKST